MFVIPEMSGWFLIVVSAKTLKLGPDFSTITNWWEPVPTEQSAFANISRVFLASTRRYTTPQIKFRQRLVIDRVILSGLVNTKPQTGRRTCINHIDQGSFKDRRPPTVFMVFYAVSYSTQDIMFWLIFSFQRGRSKIILKKNWIFWTRSGSLSLSRQLWSLKLASYDQIINDQIRSY